MFFLAAEEPILRELHIPYKNTSGIDSTLLNGDSLVNRLSNIRTANNGLLYTDPHFPDRAFPPDIPNLFSLNVLITEKDWEAMYASDNTFIIKLTTKEKTLMQIAFEPSNNLIKK